MCAAYTHAIPRRTQALADQYGAKNLDGTTPGFYWRPGSGAGATKWRIHFRGGGWCFSLVDCAGRAKTDTGSNLFWAPDVYTTTNGVFGVMADNVPGWPLDDWNTAFVMYGDGTVGDRGCGVPPTGPPALHRPPSPPPPTPRSELVGQPGAAADVQRAAGERARARGRCGPGAGTHLSPRPVPPRSGSAAAATWTRCYTTWTRWAAC